MFKLPKQFWRGLYSTRVERGQRVRGKYIPPLNYSWLEIVPVLIFLTVIAGLLAFAPTLDYEPFAREKIDLATVFNNTILEKP